MTPTAADVPYKYDVVITGVSGVTDFGVCFADSVESSLPFRTHRAIYDISQTFVERQNVSNSYGDNAQDFFLTSRQRDWSLGEQQKYFRSNQDGRYWAGQNVDVSTPGQVGLSQSINTITFAAAVAGVARAGQNDNIITASATNLYSVDPSGTITDLGVHGLGATPGKYGLCTDGSSVYLSTTAAGTVGVRRLVIGGAFSTFSATAFDSLAFVNNTLYGYSATNTSLYSMSSAGAATSLFSWKDAAGAAAGFAIPRLHAFGGKLLISSRYAQESSELWIYDGNGVSRLEVFPENFEANDIEVIYGVAYVAGAFIRQTAGSYYSKPAVLFFDGSTLGKLWEANDFNSVSLGSAGSLSSAIYPSLGVSNGRLIFSDDTTGNLMQYDPARGGVSSVAQFTANAGTNVATASAVSFTLQTRTQTNAHLFPSGTYPTSGYVISSLMDFDSSLQKMFRGVKVEFAAASDGNGGSVDIAYQVDSLTGSWTTLKTGAVSGTEYTLSGVSGHAIAIKVTLNKGTSTSGPVLKNLNVRAAPQLQQFRSGTYIIDCTGTEKYPRQLRDGSYDTITGATLATSLLSTAKATAPFSVTDRFGTFTALVDLNDPEGFDLYEVHPPQDARESACYMARLKVREV